MKKLVFHIGSLADLAKFGNLIGKNVQAGDVITLDGNLGAGKTTLTQAIAKGLDVPENCYVTSPSFAIMHEYPGGRLALYHMDFYRLHDSSEVYDLGFEEYIHGEGCTVIEWSRIAEDVVPDDSLRMEITIVDENSRNIVVRTVTTTSPLFQALAQLSAEMSG